MKQFANITVIGKDKTGVVAKVTQVLFESRANIEALEEQVTRGQFSMTIQASWQPSHFDNESLRTKFAAVARALGMEIRLRATRPSFNQRMAVLVTKESHCFESVMAAIKSASLKAEPVIVVSNHKDLEPLAKKHKLPFHYVPWNDRVKAEARTLKLLDACEADFIVLARFMKILSPDFAWRYKNKIINIHPSLLPSFPGPQPYRQAYEHVVKIAGVTAHFVSMHLDEGPILAQSSFNIRPGTPLKEIVSEGQKHEAKTLVKAIKLFLTKRLDVYWGQVKEV